MIERFFQKTGVFAESKDGGKQRVMSGYAISYGVPSIREWWGYTVFENGAAEQALKKPDMECYSLFNHDPNWVLGVNTNGSLKMDEVNQSGAQPGMRQATLMTKGDNEQIDTMISHLDAGRITRMSFACDFTADGERFDVVDQENVRVIKAGGIANLYDVSPVTYARFPQSRLDQNGFAPGVNKDIDQTMRLMFRLQHGMKIERTELETVKEFANRLTLLTQGDSIEARNAQAAGIHVDVLRQRFAHLFG